MKKRSVPSDERNALRNELGALLLGELESIEFLPEAMSLVNRSILCVEDTVWRQYFEFMVFESLQSSGIDEGTRHHQSGSGAMLPLPSAAFGKARDSNRAAVLTCGFAI